MIEQLTPETVDQWWRCASKQPPYPDLGACARLAATVDLCRLAPGKTDRELPPRTVAQALEVLRNRVPLAEAHWRAAQARNDATVGATDAPFILQRLAALKAALSCMPDDWLLDPLVEVTDLGWQVNAKFLYPKVVAAWMRAGHQASRPHDDSPACRFVESAIAHLGWRKKGGGPITAGAIGQMLRRAGLTNVGIETTLTDAKIGS